MLFWRPCQVGSPFQGQGVAFSPYNYSQNYCCYMRWGLGEAPQRLVSPAQIHPKLRPLKEGSREKPNQVQHLITQVKKRSNHIKCYSKVLSNLQDQVLFPPQTGRHKETSYMFSKMSDFCGYLIARMEYILPFSLSVIEEINNYRQSVSQF